MTEGTEGESGDVAGLYACAHRRAHNPHPRQAHEGEEATMAPPILSKHKKGDAHRPDPATDPAYVVSVEVRIVVRLCARTHTLCTLVTQRTGTKGQGQRQRPVAISLRAAAGSSWLIGQPAARTEQDQEQERKEENRLHSAFRPFCV